LLGTQILARLNSNWFTMTQQSALATPLFVAVLPKLPAIALPKDSGYTNVKDAGAKGDGLTDDTAVLQQIMGQKKEDPRGAIRGIYIPNGTYLVCGTLKWGDKRKHLWGDGGTKNFPFSDLSASNGRMALYVSHTRRLP
jgi:hypothetical protein